MQYQGKIKNFQRQYAILINHTGSGKIMRGSSL